MLATLIAATSMLVAAPAAQADPLSPRELVPLLTRSGIGPDWQIVDVIYAPPFFFDATSLPVPPEMEAQPTLAFILQETVHDGELPIDVAQAFLLLPQSERVDPYDATVTAEDDHHRVSRLLFEQPDDWLATLEEEGAEPVLKLVVPKWDGTYSVANTFEWVVPIEVEG